LVWLLTRSVTLILKRELDGHGVGPVGLVGKEATVVAVVAFVLEDASTDAVLATPVDNAKLVVELGVMALDNTDNDKDDDVEGGLLGELSDIDGFRITLGASDTVLSAPEVPLDIVEAISLDGVDDVPLCIENEVPAKVDDVVSSDAVEGVVPDVEE
jgi:predicted secreted protein